jgi:predicted ATPase
MHQGLATWQASGVETHVPDFLASIAEIYGNCGQIQEGLQTITKALNLIKKTEERWWEAEIYRLKGELLILESADNQSDAESCFNQALDVSRRQQAKSLELRATMSLSRLWQYQGKKEEARRLLSKIYGWFIEGFDTADLKDAKALLDELS